MCVCLSGVALALPMPDRDLIKKVLNVFRSAEVSQIIRVCSVSGVPNETFCKISVVDTISWLAKSAELVVKKILINLVTFKFGQYFQKICST